ncbi:MAG: alcohol dehydrogenase catalytic domain-containing protein [Deltaproteobacteria bacterium]|nr:alcohol dehydrogenase catalytic domain-containing protein [Deltaproteobacteria bacterium]
MTRVVRSTADGIAVTEQGEPPGAGVLLEVAAASICGTDLHLARFGALPFVLGHEFAGRVDGVPYAIEPTLFCGCCAECGAGATQRCVGGMQLMGFFSDGGMADAVRVPEFALVPLPEALPVSQACLVEPMAVAIHAVRRGEIESGQKIAVVGGGSIGLAAVAAIVAGGHEVAIDVRHAHQQRAAERLGARVGAAQGADVVIEATGTDTGLARCCEIVRPGGRIVLVGVFHGVVPLPAMPAIAKEIVVAGSSTYGRHEGRRETEEAAALLARRPEIAATLVTHRFPLAEARQAFAVAADRASGSIKVVVEP